jgi:hypothetical protein
MHELVGADGVRHAIDDRPRRPIDHDLPAALQPQPRPVVVDALDRRPFSAADLGADRVRRRALVDLDQELGRLLQAGDADAVGAEPMLMRV